MQELIGRTIYHLLTNDEQDLLVFETDQGDIAYETEAGCCSETWFSDILGIQDLLGQQVTSATEVELEPIDDGRTRQQQDEFYGVKLTTSRGYIDIIYRNSSNGYYGGSIRYVERFIRPETLREITGEWQAPTLHDDEHS